jgi:hypothetical protein
MQGHYSLRGMSSVSGPILSADDPGSSPQLTLFTKADCSLCDAVVDSLRHVKCVEGVDFSLSAVDITDQVQYLLRFPPYSTLR